MAVFIKNFEMPKSCFSCAGCDDYLVNDNPHNYYCALDEETRDVNEYDLWSKRPTWCPLMEVNIDADKL